MFVVSAILNIMLNTCVLQLGFVSCTDFCAHEQDTSSLLLCNVLYHVSYRGKTYRCRPPSGSARDAVSIPREFDNLKRKSFKNESFTHGRYFGLNRRAIAAQSLSWALFSSYHSNHSDRNDQMEARLTCNWHCCKQRVHCLLKFVCDNFGPSFCGRCAPPNFFFGAA